MKSRPFSLQDLEHHELQSSRTGEKYSLSAVLTQVLGFKDVFVHHDMIPPGRRASGAHAHSEREEMVVVLEGAVTATLGGESHFLEAGDFIGFPPGGENTHFIRNEGTETARILVIASNPSSDAVLMDDSTCPILSKSKDG